MNSKRSGICFTLIPCNLVISLCSSRIYNAKIYLFSDHIQRNAFNVSRRNTILIWSQLINGYVRTGMSCINAAVPTFHFWFSSYCHITFTSHTHFKQYQKKVRKCLRSTRKNTATSLHSVKVTEIQKWPYLGSEISQSVL